MGEQVSLGYTDNMVPCMWQRLEIIPYCGSSLHGDSLKTSQLKKCTQKNLLLVAEKNMSEWNTKSGILCCVALGLYRHCSKGQVELQRLTLLPVLPSATQGTQWGLLTCQGPHSFCWQQGIKAALEWETQKVTCLQSHFQKERQLRIWESLGRR